MKKGGNADEAIDMEKLRKYELQKLKYYYAVVECDSVRTSAAVYDACDQFEYETSSNALDLRFIPDEMTFTNAPKETCDSIPDDYKPSKFVTSALQRTEVELTWEQDDAERRSCLTNVNQWKDMDEKEFSTYVASDVSSEDELQNPSKLASLRNKYRQSLLGGGDDGDDDDDDTGMEMTYTPGLGQEILLNRETQNETPWESYQRKKAEEKKRKRADKRQQKKAEEEEVKHVMKKSKKQLRSEQDAAIEPESTQALQELLGETADVVHERDFNMKEIIRSNRLEGKKFKGPRRKKEEKRKEMIGGLQPSFVMNAKDDRFAALYNSADYGIDRTDARFKPTSGMKEILTERRNRKPSATTDKANRSKTDDLATLVASVKSHAHKK